MYKEIATIESGPLFKWLLPLFPIAATDTLFLWLAARASSPMPKFSQAACQDIFFGGP